jgi:hypothetical protein
LYDPGRVFGFWNADFPVPRLDLRRFPRPARLAEAGRELETEEIVADGSHVTITVNGRKMPRHKMGVAEWLASSKAPFGWRAIE